MVSDDDLIQRQDLLQSEAREILDRLGVLSLLRRVGDPIIVGSVALGLMVWRDIDIEVYCRELSPDVLFEALRPLASVPGIHKLNFRDWSGKRAIPEFPHGYYWGVGYTSPHGAEWKFDLWFVVEGTSYRMGRSALESPLSRLSPESRRDILRLKRLWFELPGYRKVVLSVDIYDAVLEHGISTPEQFERYLRERGKLR